jgi:hypothetical protein
MNTRVFAALALAGCTAGGTPVIPPDPQGACDTIDAGWTAATTGSLNFSTLVVNGLAVVPDIASVQGCLRDDGTAAAWLFGAYGADYGVVIAEASATGPQQLPSPNLTVDLYGNSPPIEFEGADFYLGNWVVNTLAPFGTTLQDASATTPDGHTLAIAFTASATP